MLKIGKAAKTTITLSTTELALLIAVAAVSSGIVIALVAAPTQVAEAVSAARDLVCSGCVGTTDIANSAVTSNKIASGAVALNVHEVEGQLVTGNAGDFITATAACPSGEKVTGGGYYINHYTDTSILTSATSGTVPNAWAAVATNPASSFGIGAFAECASLTP